MLFVKSLFKKQEVKSQDKHFNSIDNLPQWNWNKVHSTGNLNYLLELDNYRKVEDDFDLNLEGVWDEIYNEYISEFGFPEDYIDILNKKKEICRLKNEFIQTDNRLLINFINIAESELETSLNKEEGMKFESVVVNLEKYLGRKVDVKKITVYEYNNYIRNFKESNNGE